MTAVSDETGRDAFVAALASLAAAISLLERTPRSKKAAASDKMFDQMIVDYKKALEEGRAALSAAPVETITVPFNPCLAKLRDGEPFFVLIGRDKQNAIQALLRTFSEMFAVAETDRTAPENAGHVSGVHSAPDHTTMEERGR